MADLNTAVMKVMKTPEELFALIGDEVTRAMRVFGVELPKIEAEFMPRRCIVVRQSGLAGTNRSYVRMQKVLIDVAYYGATHADAEALRVIGNRFLKDFRRQMSDGFLLHSFELVNGPLHLREPQTEWPYVLETWRVLASES